MRLPGKNILRLQIKKLVYFYKGITIMEKYNVGSGGNHENLFLIFLLPD